MIPSTDHPSNAAPRVILISRLLDLEDLRRRIWERGQRSGTPVWVSEIDAGEQFADRDLDFIQVACLRHVRSAQLVICVLDGSYGTTWNEGQISILEMELATAAFSKRDIYVYRIAPFDNPDPRIKSLLHVLEIACPTARIFDPLLPNEVLEGITRILEPRVATSQTLQVGSLVQNLAGVRSPRLNYHLNLRDVQFLNRGFAPLYGRPPEKDLLGRLITQVDGETVTPYRLARLWIAVRHLSSAPFSDPRFEEYLPWWENVLSRWSSASAWYGLHGHFYLGRLAAVNSLSVIRQRMPKGMRHSLGSPSIFADGGAAASEYYSMAKLVPSLWHGHRLLRKALWNCNTAINSGSVSDASGLLDIRGHVKLRLGNPLGGVSDLKRALAIRYEEGDTERIGESEVHLGRAYALCRLNGKAERFLEAGTIKLRTAANRIFLTQGLRHLASFYTQAGRRGDAIQALLEARGIARTDESFGQLQQIEDALRKLGAD